MKNRICAVSALLIATLLSACMNGSQPTQTQLPQATNANGVGRNVNFYFPLPSDTNPDRYISVSASRHSNAGQVAGYPVTIGINVRQRGQVGSTVEALAPIDPALARRVADDNQGGQIAQQEVFRFGQQLATQSVCKNQQVRANTAGQRVTASADISAILSANGGNALRGRIPDRIQGDAIPAVELGRSGWMVSLWCS